MVTTLVVGLLGVLASGCLFVSAMAAFSSVEAERETRDVG